MVMSWIWIRQVINSVQYYTLCSNVSSPYWSQFGSESRNLPQCGSESAWPLKVKSLHFFFLYFDISIFSTSSSKVYVILAINSKLKNVCTKGILKSWESRLNRIQESQINADLDPKNCSVGHTSLLLYSY